MMLPPWFEPGFTAELGEHCFEADEIIAFARKFDPQPFHLDAELARKSAFGGLCASGWHTASVWMRKQRDHSAIAIREW
ncbi:MAG: dehydratase, partial [Nitratireductor sp.]|nr:dehydratase [Nitratireductor sp.]